MSSPRLGPIATTPTLWRVNAPGHPCDGARGIEAGRQLTEKGHQRVTLNMLQADGSRWPFPLAVTFDPHQLQRVLPPAAQRNTPAARITRALATVGQPLL